MIWFCWNFQLPYFLKSTGNPVTFLLMFLFVTDTLLASKTLPVPSYPVEVPLNQPPLITDNPPWFIPEVYDGTIISAPIGSPSPKYAHAFKVSNFGLLNLSKIFSVGIVWNLSLSQYVFLIIYYIKHRISYHRVNNVNSYMCIFKVLCL